MAYWLLKSEPDVFGIDHLIQKVAQRDSWEGVRNYQARNFIGRMMPGDLGFFYHSNAKPPGIVGVVEIVTKSYVDKTAQDPTSMYFDPKSKQDNPRWLTVDVEFRKKFPKMLSLDFLKAHIDPAEFVLLRPGNRLSVMPVPEDIWIKITTKLLFL